MNTIRPPPPTGAPPSYAFVTRMYRRNLRPIVLFVGTIGAIWTMFSAINSFQDLHIANSQQQPKLAPISIALGVMYLVASCIEAFGVFSALSQRLALARLYAYGSIVVVLLVVGSSLLRTIVHFTLKSDLINECTNVASGETITYSSGIWGPTSTTTLSADDAASWCQDAWNHDTFSEILTLLVMIFLSGLFSSIAWAYYRQLLDPTSPANFMRAPSNQVRMEAFPTRYNEPFGNASNVPGLGYNYPPPSGPPPHDRDEVFVPPYDDSKLPGYGVGVGANAYEKKEAQGDPFIDGGPSERDVTSPRGRARGYDL